MNKVILGGIGVCFSVLYSSAAVVSLTNDFSLASNPNGAWSYLNNASILPFQTPQPNGNVIIPALANGYWGAGGDLNLHTPEIFKALVNGSGAGESDNDFLISDIVGHSPNDGSTLFASWTAPSSGSISSLTALGWYSHSLVNRSNDFVLTLNASALGSGVVSSSLNQDRNHALSINPSDFSVTAGDVISIGITKSAGQSDGSLSGMALDFTFTPVPEPSVAAILGMSLLFLGARSRSKRS